MRTGNNDELVGSTGGLLPHSTDQLVDSELEYLNTSIHIILKVYPVLVLILGCFGNLLSFCVLLRAAMRRYSTFCYLACLALVDIGVILTFCVNFISLYHFDYDIQEVSFLCKLFAFCIYFLPQYSSWILVAVSIDRVISAKYLRLAKKWTKPRHSVLVTLVLGIFLALLNGHFFLYEKNSIIPNNSTQLDHRREQQHQRQILNNETVIQQYLPLNPFTRQNEYFLLPHDFSKVEFIGDNIIVRSDSSASYEAFTPIVPQYINDETTIQTPLDNFMGVKQAPILFQDVNIIYCSLENSSKYKDLYVYWAWIDLAMNVFIPFTAMIACTIMIILTLIRSSSRAGSTSARRSRRRRNISVMLITVNLVFITLTAPIVVLLSVHEYFKDENNAYREAILVLIKIFSIILMNLNHSVNIVIYSVTAKEFRSEMVNFLQSVLYCIIGKPSNGADLDFFNDDGTWSSRFRRFRQNLFKCCRTKLRFSSTNTTDSSGAHHRTVGTPVNNTRSPTNQMANKLNRLNGNGKTRTSLPKTNEALLQGCNHRLAVQVQADAASSVYEREDVSFHGLSVSTED